MLYFRFDINKEDFKAENHRSILFGDGAYDMAYIKIVDDENAGEYTKRVKEIFEKESEGEISFEDSSNLVEQVVSEFIKNEWTLNGCSCFELNEEGLQEAESYGHIYERDYVTVFEGERIEVGHDGEEVAYCNKVIYQANSKDFVNILFDLDVEDDTTYSEKIQRILKLIKKG